MPHELFDRNELVLQSLNERKHDFSAAQILHLDSEIEEFKSKDLQIIASRIVQARKTKSSVILMMGAHVIRRGNSRFIIDLIKRGLITHVGVNGACAIHDFELAKIGATTESVEKYISEGQFGLWSETGEINEIISQSRTENIGFGEAIGKHIFENDFPYKDISIFGKAYEYDIPLTVHVSIGQDIIHEHPNFDAAAVGELSYRDFLILAKSVQSLEHGVLLNYGTAVMGPEVYLKALSMARNVAKQKGEEIAHFTTAVFDLHDIEGDFRVEKPKTSADYYFRPYKTILVRTVKDGGESYYLKGDHQLTFPNLYKNLIELIEGNKAEHD